MPKTSKTFVIIKSINLVQKYKNLNGKVSIKVQMYLLCKYFEIWTTSF